MELIMMSVMRLVIEYVFPVTPTGFIGMVFRLSAGVPLHSTACLLSVVPTGLCNTE